MKKFSISVVAGLLTFSIGVVVTVLWMTRHTPELINETKPPADRCLPVFMQKIDSFQMGGDGYFPKGVFYANEEMDQSVRRRYAKYLTQMREPSVVGSQPSDGTYRFTWLRSFHPKVVVRVWTHAGKRMLTVKELNRTNEMQGGPISVNQTRPLNENEWAEFTRLFEAACVWSLPTHDEVLANDGAVWMVEANSAGHYQVVVTPVPEGSYRELCLYMLKLSGLPLDPAKGEIY